MTKTTARLATPRQERLTATTVRRLVAACGALVALAELRRGRRPSDGLPPAAARPRRPAWADRTRAGAGAARPARSHVYRSPGSPRAAGRPVACRARARVRRPAGARDAAPRRDRARPGRNGRPRRPRAVHARRRGDRVLRHRGHTAPGSCGCASTADLAARTTRAVGRLSSSRARPSAAGPASRAGPARDRGLCAADRERTEPALRRSRSQAVGPHLERLRRAETGAASAAEAPEPQARGRRQEPAKTALFAARSLSRA